MNIVKQLVVVGLCGCGTQIGDNSGLDAPAQLVFDDLEFGDSMGSIQLVSNEEPMDLFVDRIAGDWLSPEEAGSLLAWEEEVDGWNASVSHPVPPFEEGRRYAHRAVVFAGESGAVPSALWSDTEHYLVIDGTLEHIDLETYSAEDDGAGQEVL